MMFNLIIKSTHHSPITRVSCGAFEFYDEWEALSDN